MSSMLWSISTAQCIKRNLEMHHNFRVPQFDDSIMILYDCTVQQYCLQCVMQALWSASPDVMHRHCRVHQLPRIERRTSAVGRGFFSCEHQTDFMSYFQNMGFSRRKFSIGITSQTQKIVQFRANRQRNKLKNGDCGLQADWKWGGVMRKSGTDTWDTCDVLPWGRIRFWVGSIVPIQNIHFREIGLNSEDGWRGRRPHQPFPLSLSCGPLCHSHYLPIIFTLLIFNSLQNIFLASGQL